MADRLENEMKDMEKRREAFNSALGLCFSSQSLVETCDQQLHDSLKQLNSSVRSVLYPKQFSYFQRFLNLIQLIMQRQLMQNTALSVLSIAR